MPTRGTNMETKMTPTYNTLTLADLEENLYKIIGKKYGSTKGENIFKWLFNILEMAMRRH